MGWLAAFEVKVVIFNFYTRLGLESFQGPQSEQKKKSQSYKEECERSSGGERKRRQIQEIWAEIAVCSHKSVLLNFQDLGVEETEGTRHSQASLSHSVKPLNRTTFLELLLRSKK